ncbi:MAG: hypothetical protein KF701_06745 [Anaerolineales bacterium]|nr:MAG: hypothetical protein KF701_06745 [Anaerolineales bacterium]
MAKTQPFLTSRTALAGVLAGLGGFLAFLFIHQALIRPIWFIAPFGAVVAALAGLLVAWAYDALRPRLPQNTWLAVLAFVALLTLTQVAAFFASSVQEPIANMVFRNQALPGRLGTILTRFAIDLFLTSAVAGALAGWLVGRSKQAAGRMALAALGFAIGPGHNTPFFAGVASSQGTLWALILGAIGVAGIVFGVALQRRK